MAHVMAAPDSGRTRPWRDLTRAVVEAERHRGHLRPEQSAQVALVLTALTDAVPPLDARLASMLPPEALRERAALVPLREHAQALAAAGNVRDLAEHLLSQGRPPLAQLPSRPTPTPVLAPADVVEATQNLGGLVLARGLHLTVHEAQAVVRVLQAGQAAAVAVGLISSPGTGLQQLATGLLEVRTLSRPSGAVLGLTDAVNAQLHAVARYPWSLAASERQAVAAWLEPAAATGEALRGALWQAQTEQRLFGRYPADFALPWRKLRPGQEGLLSVAAAQVTADAAANGQQVHHKEGRAKGSPWDRLRDAVAQAPAPDLWAVQATRPPAPRRTPTPPAPTRGR